MWMPFALEKSGSLYKTNEFREGKLKLLEDFDITITESERETFNTLTSPRQIEKFIREIINNRLG
jgi:hypothetical protein